MENNNLKKIVQDCNHTCQALSDLLKYENEQLEARNIKAIEDSIKEKRKLTIKLEDFVNKIKNNFQKIQAQQEALKELKVFKKLIESYKELLARNTILLKAAQTATKTILSSIQKHTQKTTVKTYNAYGQVQTNTEKGPSLINYSV